LKRGYIKTELQETETGMVTEEEMIEMVPYLAREDLNQVTVVSTVERVDTGTYSRRILYFC
jgi:hypothetical protein